MNLTCLMELLIKNIYVFLINKDSLQKKYPNLNIQII